jgi:hypothetical protein
MAIPTTAFPGATAGSTPAIYPVGSSSNNLQATGFIPEIWSGKLVEKFYASTVLAAISNTDYEGEIKNQGDRVKIRTKPTVTIRDYRADGPSGSGPPDRRVHFAVHRQWQVLLAHARRRHGDPE